jgi:hypothetical protein
VKTNKTRGLCAVAFAVAAGCGPGGGGSGPADGGSEGSLVDSGGSDASDGGGDAASGATCASYAAAQCNFLQTCQPGTLQSLYGDMATCVKDVTGSCTFNMAAPRTGQTPAWLSACTAYLGTATCSPMVPAPGDACAIVGGGTAGESCGINAQCATAACERSPGALCGTCTSAGKAGDSCASASVTCERGLTCGSKHKCVKVVDVGATCDLGVTTACVAGSDCVVGDGGTTSGTCMASGTAAGAACNPKGIGAPRCDGAAGFFCSSGQCAAITYGATGAMCGVMGMADDQCTDGDECVAGTCTARIAEGKACTVATNPSCLGSVCVAGDGGTGGTCTAIDPACTAPDGGAGGLDFQPSNVALPDITKQQAMAQDEDVAGLCGVQTDTSVPVTDCFGSPIVVVKQPDGSKVNLVVMKSLTLEANAQIGVTGTVPLVLVSLSTVTISGVIDGNSALLQQGPGGFASNSSNAAGLGIGGGPAGSGSSHVGGGGGSFCGLGGAGGGTAAQGTIYGTPDERPLIGGAGGGGGVVNGGAGGGAIQIVAAGALSMVNGSLITVGGQGSTGGGGGADQNGGGGGAGGAILLEGTTVTVAGILAANGGGGGGGKDGADATADANVAAGGAASASVAAGGAGAAAATLAGVAGKPGGASFNAGGGGGGAGYLRINTSSGMADLTGGTLSPAATTTCSTLGKVRGLMAGP